MEVNIHDVRYDVRRVWTTCFSSVSLLFVLYRVAFRAGTAKCYPVQSRLSINRQDGHLGKTDTQSSSLSFLTPLIWLSIGRTPLLDGHLELVPAFLDSLYSVTLYKTDTLVKHPELVHAILESLDLTLRRTRGVGTKGVRRRDIWLDCEHRQRSTKGTLSNDKVKKQLVLRAKQLLCFLVHFCTTTTWNLPIRCFMKDVDIQRQIFPSLFEHR